MSVFDIPYSTYRGKNNSSVINVFCQFQVYLGKFGYLSGPSRETGNLMSHDDLTAAIKKLQKMGHIPETGVIDPRTKELMERPRCGLMDLFDGSDRRKKRYVLAPSKWQKTKLTYR